MLGPGAQLTYDLFNLAGTFLLVLPILLISWLAATYRDRDFLHTMLLLIAAAVFGVSLLLHSQGMAEIGTSLPTVFIFLAIPSWIAIGIAKDVRYGSYGWLGSLVFLQAIGEATVFRPETFTTGGTGLLALQGLAGYTLYMAFVGVVGGLFGMTIRNFSE